MELDNQSVLSSFCQDVNQSFLNNEEIYFNVKKIISSVIANRDAWPFREAVKEIDAPNYNEIIKSPMDLSIINQKIDDKIYLNFNQLEKDMKLIVNNSELYNGQFNGFTTNVYACWRLFRKQTKKYLNQDLSLEDKDAFMFPPRYNLSKKRASSDSIGKRTKYKKQKKSNRFQALELLYNATQNSIESTFQKFAFSPSSDCENNQLDVNQPKKYQFSIDQNMKPTGFYNEAFANLDNYSYQNGFYTEENRNENLVFKSLNEWNKQIDENGLSIVLPDKSIFVDNSPVDQNWLTNYPHDLVRYKTVFNENMFQKPIDGQLHNGQLILNRHSTNCKKEKISKIKKSKENSKNSDNMVTSVRNCKISQNSKIQNEDEKIKKDDLNKESKSTDLNEGNRQEQTELKQGTTKKRLVIKLSKLNNDWKPISLNDNQESGSEYDSSSDSSTSSSSCSCDSD